MITGEEGRDAGIRLAEDHADAVQKKWVEAAGRMLWRFMKTDEIAAGKTFSAQTVRAFAEEQGLPLPPKAQAWGGVMLRARRAGYIENVGFEKATNPEAHCRPSAQWKRVK